MVGKNNHIRTIKSNLKEHYKAYKAGRRWIYASLASLALGAGLLLGGSMTASADVQSTSTQDPVDSVGNESGDAAAASQKATAVPLKTTATSDTSNNTAAADSSATTSTSDSNGSANTANTNGSVKATQATPVTSDNNAENTATTQTTSVAKTAADAATSDTETAQKSATTQSTKSKTLVDPTEEQLDAAKASAEQVYATTKQPQEIDAIAPDSAASLTLSATAVGHGTNAKSPLTLTLTTNAKAGDVYVINIPASTQVYTFASADPLVSAAGTTTVTQNPDKSTTVTDTFTADSTTTQLIKLNLGGNYGAQDGGMPDVGKTLTKTITWSIKHAGQTQAVDQTPLTFTQTIQPTTDLTTVTMIFPEAKQVPQILPNQNYVFSLGINEADGIQDDTSKTARVNSADNYGGSTVTIPVPTGFVLDTNNTNLINALTDGSTITQPGGKGTDVIITVPAKAGNQGWQDVQPYKIVGAFDVPQTTTAQTLTAPGDVTFSQIMNSDGDKLTASADPWSVTLIPNQGGSDVGNSTAATKAKGNSTNTNKFVLDTDPTDDPQYLASFGFTYNSAAESTNTKLQITIPDGLNATSIQTPATAVSPSVYLPDTTSYTYTLTLADGTTETGTVNAGDKVTPTDKSAIRTAVFVPNKLAPGANANQLGGASSFVVDGNLSTTYDDGTPVKNGDTLVASMAGSFDADGKPLKGNASVTQTVVEATSLGVGYVEHHQTQLPNGGPSWDWNNPGNPNAGTFKVETGGNRGQTTYNIFEPVFYFVIPKSSTVASTNQPTGAKISEFTSDDGHTVVKFDYTGSGVTIDTRAGTGTYGTVTLANNSDALPGNYPFYMYIVSPTTKIANDTPAVDSTYVENNPNAFLMGDMGSGNWNITTASSFFNTSLAKGNQNVDAITKGTSDDQGDSTLNFYDSVVYTSLEDNAKNSSASVAINLPTVGDSKGSQYTFKLTGPIVVPTNYTVTSGQGAPINPTILYSTQPQAVNTNATTPDTTGYVTAAQVGDNWSSIRSIIIQMKGIQPNTSTGRIQISGTTDNFNEQAGKTGYLQTIFYGNGANASVNSNDASIKITGTSTINARYHYTDSNGDEKYIDLDDLSKTLNDNADTFTNDYPTQLSGFSAADQALIPTGYKLVTDASGIATPTIVDGTGDGKAEFRQVAQYYYDGDFVQYDLVGNATTQVKFVDDDNNGATVGTPKTISGTPGNTTNWNIGDVPTGYKLATGSATTGSYTFQDDNNAPVQIHLNHIVDHSTATTTRTITYVVDDLNYTGQVPETQTQTIDWKIVKDEATGVSAATPQDAYYQQNVPTIDGYTADKTIVPQEGLGAVKATDLPKNEDVTVTYKANAQTAAVQYVDDGNNGAVVGTDMTLTGTTSGKADWTTENIPAKYELAKGQAATGTYQFTNGTDQTVAVHLTHKMDHSTATTTRTIHYVVDDPNYTGQVPETQTQKVTWNVITDEVNGHTVATPAGAYYQQTAPTIKGYTADKTAVPQKGLAAATTLPKNEDVTVTYKADAQTATVQYVDDGDNGAVVGTDMTLTGATSGTADWTTANIPAKYELAKGQAATGTYQFTNGTDQTVEVHLTHKMDHSTATTTRTIHYVVDDPNYTGQVPETQTQKVTWNVITDEVNGNTVATPAGAYYQQTAPTIKGYTADPTVVKQEGMDGATTLPKNEDVTVHYKAAAQSATVQYVDDGNNGAVVGTDMTLTGATSGTADWTTENIPAKYELAKGQAATGTYQFTNDTDQTVEVHLTHKMDHSTATTTRTIHYVVDDPNYTGQVPETQTQKVTWNVITDEVNGDTVATPTSAYYQQTAPTITGYTADPAKVDQEGLAGATTLPANEDVTVHYKAAAQSATVQYVDDGNNGAVVGTDMTLTGATSGTADWTTDNIPPKYELAKGQAATGTYQFTNGTNQTVEVHLTHKMDHSTATTTRTIHYVVDDPNYTGQVPETQTQKVTWNVIKDEVNGNTVATPAGAYYQQTAPTIKGYTADKTVIPQEGLAGATTLPKNEDVTVTYKADAQTATVQYVDDGDNGAVVGTDMTLTGATSGTADWTTDNIPAKYELAKGQAATGTYQFTNDTDQTVEVHLTHKMDHSTATTTRTIHYVVDDPNYTGQVPETQTQKVTWNVITDEVNGDTVATPAGAYYEQTAPTITGYTADPAKVDQEGLAGATTLPANEDVTVHYKAAAQSATVQYVDDGDNGAVIGTDMTLTGATSGTADWTTDNIPAKYELAKGQAATGTYQFTNDTDQTVEVHLTHKMDHSTATTTRTIHYVVDDPNYTGQVPETQTQKVTWNVITDEVNGNTVATPAGAYYQQTAPTITGYTADPAKVDQEGLAGATTLPANEDVTVHYKAAAQSATVQYVDDGNNGAVVGTDMTLTGATSGTADWTTDNIPAKYELAKGQAATGTYQFTNGTDQTIEVHLTHKMDHSTATTTRTIHYVVNDPNYTGQVPETQTQKVTWNVITDEVNGNTVATPAGAYYEQTAPTIKGYTADLAKVDQEGMDGATTLPKNEDVTVTYKADAQTATVQYVDDGNNGAVVGTDMTLNGQTSGTADWTTENVPAKYELAKGQAATGTYQFTNGTDQTVEVHLTHKMDHSTATTTRTIHYMVDDPNYTGQVPETQTQKVTWNVITDEVNGNTVATPAGAYYEQTAPTIKGYTADPAKVDQEGLAGATTLPKNEDVTVTYTPNAQSVMFEYVDDDNDGAVVGTPTVVDGKTSGKYDWNTNSKPTSFELSAGQAANGTYQFTNDSKQLVKIHLSHIIDHTTTTTTRTIHYVVDDPNFAGQVPAPTVQTVTWNVSTDEVTGESVATPQGAYYEQVAPNLPGYTANPSKVGQQAFGSIAARDVPMYNEDVVVTYTAIPQPSNGGSGNPTNEPSDNPTETTTTGDPERGTATGTTKPKVVTHEKNPGHAVTNNKGKGSQSSTGTDSNAGNTGVFKTPSASGTAMVSSQNSSVSNGNSNTSATNQQQLPQTNEQSQSTIGLGLLGLMASMLGLIGLKRRKRDDE